MSSKRLLLIGWDAADWRLVHPLIDAGEMPALKAIVEGGASGELRSTQPPIAAMQWTSLATGKRAWQHGISHPLELLPDGSRAVPVTATSRRALAVWEILARQGKRALAVGWPATHSTQASDVRVVSDRYAEPTAGPGIKPWPPAPRGTYSPDELRSKLDSLRMSPEDVQADVVSRFVPEWKRIDQKRDHRLGQLRLFLATDFSFQAALMQLLMQGDWDFAAVRFPALGAISPLFLPYYPPRRPSIGEGEFSIYKDVIRQTHRNLDWLLSGLVRAAGKDVAVIVASECGAHPPESRAARPIADGAGWKSPYGIFAAAGPGFARDSLVFGASALDVVPTILTWFDLPIGDDMEGRVLVESFVSTPEIQRVKSWETERSGAVSSNEAAGASSAGLRRESNWHLAQSCLEGGRLAEALPTLEGVFREFPENADFAHGLFQCQLALGHLPEAEQTLELLLETLPPGVVSLLPRAELCAAQRKIQQARTWVEQIRRLNPSDPDAMRRLGLLLLRLRDWNGLLELAQRALEIDETEPIAWVGLAEAQLRKGEAAAAERSALRAIGLMYFLPQAHFILTRALVAQSKWTPAREAMQTLLRLQPANASAAAYAKRMDSSVDPAVPRME